ncbi:MAG: YIP1 family protein [Candidatus Altiarchaeales archaeon]|nr:YIP1 family protein [Candidatus Altiarchaeales archaeon]
MKKDAGKRSKKEKKEMKLNFPKKLKGILFSPRTTFRELSGDSPLETLTYYLILLLFVPVFFALLGALVYYLIIPHFLGGVFPSFSYPIGYEVLVVIAIVFFIVGGLLLAFIDSIVLHISVRVVAGGGKSFRYTLQAVMYAYTPFVLFWWVPLVNVFTPLWTFVLVFLALREFHAISTMRAIAVVMLPVILAFIIGFVWKLLAGFI